MSGVLDRMAESGWILKNVKDDRRVLNIRLTDKALSFRDKIINDTEELNQEILSMFSMEERLLLIRMLKDLRK
ncbi:MAG: hypothetical protein BWX45_00118 [Deltaproteobacteria bacterium ADurb.Bin002]|nr:MAG: hypothetical protein BWX45_00118 [Deltaproteobacteria bacterium ADurb.Bin002]